MAKKQIISDFSSLKGMITFSEKESIASTTQLSKPNKKKTSPAGHSTKHLLDNDLGLHVGQYVILMDSDLRGKIISLGKTVIIELADGLEIEAAYGEFAVINSLERSMLKQTKVRNTRKETRKPTIATPRPDGTLTVDLHIEAIPGGRNIPKGQHLQFQMETFRKIIRSNLSHRGMKITFIHGIGDGILKATIRKELDEVLALHCTYTVGDPALTTVIIH